MSEQDELYELIQQYLGGDLKGEALSKVKNRLKNDNNFASEVALHRALFEMELSKNPQVEQLESSLNKIRQKETVDTNKEKVAPRSIATILLFIALLLGLGLTSAYYLAQYRTSIEKTAPLQETPPIIAAADISKKSLRSESLFSNLKGEQTDKFSNALKLYDHKDFKSALKQLAKTEKNKPLKYDEQLLKGLCHLQLEQYETSIKIFKDFEVFDKRKSLDKSKWCLAIAYLDMGDKENYNLTLELIKKEKYYFPKDLDIDNLLNAIGYL